MRANSADKLGHAGLVREVSLGTTKDRIIVFEQVCYHVCVYVYVCICVCVCCVCVCVGVCVCVCVCVRVGVRCVDSAGSPIAHGSAKTPKPSRLLCAAATRCAHVACVHACIHTRRRRTDDGGRGQARHSRRALRRAQPHSRSACRVRRWCSRDRMRVAGMRTRVRAFSSCITCCARWHKQPTPSRRLISMRIARSPMHSRCARLALHRIVSSMTALRARTGHSGAQSSIVDACWNIINSLSVPVWLVSLLGRTGREQWIGTDR